MSKKPEFRHNALSSYPFEEKYGYSRVVRVGNQVFVSGTTARSSTLEGDTYVQARAALTIVANSLADVGASMEHVVRTVVYVIDLADIDQIARAHSEIFGHVRPASTLVQVAALTPSSARVEVEVTAVVPD